MPALYLLLIVLVGAVILLLVNFDSILGVLLESGSRVGGQRLSTLSELQQKQIELFTEANKLLTTLATLALGASGAFILARYKDGMLPLGQLVRGILSWLLLVVSLGLGYFAYQVVIWMLDQRFLNLISQIVLIPTTGQLLTLGLAMLLISWLVMDDLWHRRTS